jgi:signal transduction histidine kinase
LGDAAIARAGHVFAVVLWIGGVGFVTTVLLPAIRHLQGARGAIGLFRCIPAAICMASPYHHWLTGLSGLYMLIRFDLWGRFLSASFWWIHAMVVVWLLFTVMLYLAEPLFLHRWLDVRAKEKPRLPSYGRIGSWSYLARSRSLAPSPAATASVCRLSRK